MCNELLIILSVGFTLFCACGLINEFIKDFRNKKSSTPLNNSIRVKPQVQKSKIIREVVRWLGPVLLDLGIKKYPTEGVKVQMGTTILNPKLSKC